MQGQETAGGEYEAVNRIGEVFNHTFAHWQISLPAGSIEAHQRGEIRGAGWTIRYLFGEDENGEYLDYYASHRMTNDRHVRIYANGSIEHLEAIQEFIIFPPARRRSRKRRSKGNISRRTSESLRSWSRRVLPKGLMIKNKPTVRMRKCQIIW